MNLPSTRSGNLLKGLLGLAVAAVLALMALLGRRPSGNYLMLAAGVVGLLLLLQQPGLGLVALAALSFTLPITVGTGTEGALTPPVLLIPAVVGVWLADGLHRGRGAIAAKRLGSVLFDRWKV